MCKTGSRPGRLAFSAVALVALSVIAGHVSTPRAGATVGVDAATLNVLLPPLTPNEIEVELPGNQRVTVILDQLRVRGFDPAEGPDGQILAAVRVLVPELGLEVPLEPRLSLKAVDRGGSSVLELRFESAVIPLPIAGSVDLARFIPPLRYPAESIYMLRGADGDVAVTTRLIDVKMGVKAIRFEFELSAAKP